MLDAGCRSSQDPVRKASSVLIQPLVISNGNGRVWGFMMMMTMSVVGFRLGFNALIILVI